MWYDVNKSPIYAVLTILEVSQNIEYLQGDFCNRVLQKIENNLSNNQITTEMVSTKTNASYTPHTQGSGKETYLFYAY